MCRPVGKNQRLPREFQLELAAEIILIVNAPNPTAERYCIVGAGTSGLAVAKNFLHAGIPFDCLEREDDLGGNWNFGKPHSSVYASTHLISSKQLTEYTDFPMPESYPEFPSHVQVLEYLRSYAREFHLNDHIEFNTSVERMEPDAAGWKVTLADSCERSYRGVVIANGHNWHPNSPSYPGKFAGETIHSSEYKTADVFEGKRVLVVGGGNSGCDIAVDAAVHADKAFLSLRRGYHVLPKFFKGMPIDQFNERWLRWRMPLWLRRLGARMVVRWTLGSAEQVGMPPPDHKLFESHPIINSQLHYYLGHGDLEVRGDIERFDGRIVKFVDGSSEEVDLVLFATGFQISFPFIDSKHLNWHDGKPQLFLNVFHPERDDLFCAGLIQPDSGQWGLVDYQAQLITRYLQSLEQPSQCTAWFRELKQNNGETASGGIRYLDTSRHLLEVEHFSYRQRLQCLIARFGEA